MANNFNTLDKWRSYFRTANDDIFDIIEHAIMVAASDYPYDLTSKRDRIAELLFSCKATKCFGCDRIELALPITELNTSDQISKSLIEAGGAKDTKQSNVNNCSREISNQVSNFNYREAEALNDEIEEEYKFHGEVLKIKHVFDNYQQESDSLLFDSLRRLRLMTLNVDTLKATEIGKSVNSLRKHRLKEIRCLAKALVDDWKIMVDSWAASDTRVEVLSESAKTSTVEDGEGLPSPPMDEGAFFATPTSMELSRFFDGMDDDGNPQENGGTQKSTANPSFVAKDTKAEAKRNGESTMKKQLNRPLPVSFGPKATMNESGLDQQKPALKPKVNNVQKPIPRLESGRCDENSVTMKLEAAKRKLHERYQEAENAKKQRTIQVVELHDLPKQSAVQRNQHTKPGLHKRQWGNTRR